MFAKSFVPEVEPVVVLTLTKQEARDLIAAIGWIRVVDLENSKPRLDAALCPGLHATASATCHTLSRFVYD